MGGSVDEEDSTAGVGLRADKEERGFTEVCGVVLCRYLDDEVDGVGGGRLRRLGVDSVGWPSPSHATSAVSPVACDGWGASGMCLYARMSSKLIDPRARVRGVCMGGGDPVFPKPTCRLELLSGEDEGGVEREW